MRQIAVICVVTFLLVGQAGAADQAEKAEAAENKAEVLEMKASAEGSQTPPAAAQIITKPEAQAVDPAGAEPLDDAITCLARTLYWEAKGETEAAMQAIAYVVMNRLGHEGFPNTICGVVKQGQEQGSCQFSWWCDGREDNVEEEDRYVVAKEIARKVLNRQVNDPTGGAMYFHREDVAPNWSKIYVRTVQVGEHIFYKPAGGKAR